MIVGNLVWGGALLVLVVWEIYAAVSDHGRWTLSEATRRLFHTSTRNGRLVFGAFWAACSVAFGLHILGLF